MLKGDWRRLVALGLAIGIGIGLGIEGARLTGSLFAISMELASYPNKPPYPQPKSPKPQYDYEQETEDAVLWSRSVQQKGKAEIAPGQDEPTSKDEDNGKDTHDLAAQWLAASSAAWMVRLTFWQLFVGLGGLAGLGATLYYARETAKAAIKAAKEAAEQVEIGRREFLATYRPKLTVRYIEGGEPHYGYKPMATLNVDNVGESDAKLIRLGGDIFTRKRGEPRTSFFDAIPADLAPTLLVPPGKTAKIPITGKRAEFSSEEVAEILKGDKELCLLGIVLYTDGVGVQRSCSFLRVWNVKFQKFTRVGTEPVDELEEWDFEY